MTLDRQELNLCIIFHLSMHTEINYYFVTQWNGFSIILPIIKLILSVYTTEPGPSFRFGYLIYYPAKYYKAPDYNLGSRQTYTLRKATK